MKKIDEFLIDNKIIILKGAIALFFPLLLCVIYCAVQNRSITGVYLPNGEWNDELFYFKQVEGIVHGGFPKGYFGFDESHAEVLSFAAWSPILVFPWVIWGWLFGWDLISPIWCNIFLLCVTTCAFVVITRATWKQMISLALGMGSFVLFERYMLSGMPEIICFCMVIMISALTYSYLFKETNAKLILMLVMSAVMTLMRPYLLLFMILPLILFVRKKKAGWIISGIAVFLVTLGAYACIKKYLGAAYFTPLFSMDWLTDFFTKGIGTGFHNFFARLYYMSKEFVKYMIEGVRSGYAPGAFFVTYITVMAIFAVRTGIDICNYRSANKEKKEKLKKEGLLKRIVIQVNYFAVMVGMLFALLLMYKLEEGSKHLLTFIAGGIFLMSVMTNKAFVKYIVFAIVCVYLFMIKGTSAYDYQVPFGNRTVWARDNDWESIFDWNLDPVEDGPNFDNVVIWTLSDYKDNGSVREALKWQILYFLPEGYGISCCQHEYVIQNIDDLKSKYIVTVADGEIDKMLSEKGKELIYRDEYASFYRLR